MYVADLALARERTVHFRIRKLWKGLFPVPVSQLPDWLSIRFSTTTNIWVKPDTSPLQHPDPNSKSKYGDCTTRGFCPALCLCVSSVLLDFVHLAWGRGSWSLCLSCICLLAVRALVCVAFSLPPWCRGLAAASACGPLTGGYY